jgi:hypothetical protein
VDARKRLACHGVASNNFWKFSQAELDAAASASHPVRRIHSPSTRLVCSIRISSAMLVRDSRTSSANGAFGRHERQDSAGIRLVTAASRWRSSVRKSIAFVVRQAGQRTHRNR